MAAASAAAGFARSWRWAPPWSGMALEHCRTRAAHGLSPWLPEKVSPMASCLGTGMPAGSTVSGCWAPAQGRGGREECVPRPPRARVWWLGRNTVASNTPHESSGAAEAAVWGRLQDQRCRRVAWRPSSVASWASTSTRSSTTNTAITHARWPPARTTRCEWSSTVVHSRVPWDGRVWGQPRGEHGVVGEGLFPWPSRPAQLELCAQVWHALSFHK